LNDEGYVATVADDGEAALDLLAADELPDLILLDLRMPGMNGWQFRTAQRRDSRLATIPVVAISADGSAQAAAISADAFLSKPLETAGLLTTIERVLKQNERYRSQIRRNQAERLTSLGRVTAGVGQQINSPLSLVMISVRCAHERLQRLQQKAPVPVDRDALNEGIEEVRNTLAESLSGLELILGAVRNMQMQSRELDGGYAPLKIETVLDESIARACLHRQLRTRITKHYRQVPEVKGNVGALAQVFLSLLTNAAESISEGSPANHEIAVFTSFDGDNVIVEIGDTGRGVAADVLRQIFDPLLATKRSSEGSGLGLAISQEIVTMHGGRLVIESELGKGTVCSVYLPPAALSELTLPRARVERQNSGATGAAPRSLRRSLKRAVDAYEKELLLGVLRAMGHKRSLAAKFLGISRKSLWKKLIKHGLQSRRVSLDDPESE
jgi:signal transduction histidine kinase